jgi:hypothetical protein
MLALIHPFTHLLSPLAAGPCFVHQTHSVANRRAGSVSQFRNMSRPLDPPAWARTSHPDASRCSTSILGTACTRLPTSIRGPGTDRSGTSTNSTAGFSILRTIRSGHRRLPAAKDLDWRTQTSSVPEHHDLRPPMTEELPLLPKTPHTAGSPPTPAAVFILPPTGFVKVLPHVFPRFLRLHTSSPPVC